MGFTILVTAVLAVQTPAGDTSAYLDAESRRLVAAARARRETIDRSITRYRTTIKERIGVGIRALRRDRMLWRRELALRIEWRRDSVGRIEVLGAREAVPAAMPAPQVPEHVKREVADYAFDPADDRLTVGWGRQERIDSSDTDRRVQLVHPLAPNSEAHYRFAAGDSSAVVFPDGRIIRLRELRVMPRRLEFRLISGSFWIDEESHAVVRALFRPARPFDFEQDIGKEDGDDIPGFVKPIRAEVRFLTIDYGLWAGRWWLPRLIAMDAVATAGSFLQLPMRYERLYIDYEVAGDTAVHLAPRPPPDTTGADSTTRARCREQAPNVECRCHGATCRGFVVSVPDTQRMLLSADLPPPFGSSGGDSLISSSEMDELTRTLGKLPQAPWQFRARPPRWGLARFNRVEGLSLGARGELDFGRLRLDGAGRIATSDAELDLEAGLLRETGTARLRLAGYRRLAAVDPIARSLAIGNSLGSLLLGRDDGDYFRATGVELTIAPPVTVPQRFTIRVYAERQRRALKRTDFSVPHAFRETHVFRPNVAADSADQIGASLTLHTQMGIDPARPQWSADVTLDGSAGTYRFGRVSTTLRLAAPLGPRLAGAVELAGGMADGRVPVQRFWYLGGPGTLRGYGGNATSGDAFWRARLELANRWPAARGVLFLDVGRAGPREHLSLAQSLAGAGVGVSFLDGLVRLDMARAIRSPTGWRVDFYTDAAL